MLNIISESCVLIALSTHHQMWSVKTSELSLKFPIATRQWFYKFQLISIGIEIHLGLRVFLTPSYLQLLNKHGYIFAELQKWYRLGPILEVFLEHVLYKKVVKLYVKLYWKNALKKKKLRTAINLQTYTMNY